MGNVGVRFLDAPDTRLAADASTVAGLVAVLDECSPEGLYVPWVLDPHRDHAMANAVVAAALRSAAATPRWIRSYEVWCPTIANVAVDISDLAPAKVELLRCYRSQFVAAKPDLVMALNRHRSLGVGRTHAEAFCELRHDEYLRLVGGLLSPHR
jgi:LmbE family N-acetylglucosaminyl deacetylase